MATMPRMSRLKGAARPPRGQCEQRFAENEARAWQNVHLWLACLVVLETLGLPSALAQTNEIDQSATTGQPAPVGQPVQPAEPLQPSLPVPAGTSPQQEAQPTRISQPWRIEPSITARETWTDNVDLRSSAFARGDFVTEIIPGLAIHGHGPRTRMDLDYRPTALFYARNSERNDFLNGLTASGSVEAIERLLFVEAQAQIAQQAVTAFGTQSVSNINQNSNRTETRVFSVSPYSRGLLGSWAAYDIRYQATALRTIDQVGADTDARTWSGKLESANPFGNFGWILDYFDGRNSFDTVQDVRSRMGRATITYRIQPDIMLFARGGVERNNYGHPDEDYATNGIGFQWAPTARTRITAENDKRFFGRGYKYSFQHRTSGSSWSVLASKDDSTSINQLTRSSGRGSLFDRFFDLMSAQVTDPDQRAHEVRQMLSTTGIPAESTPLAGYLAGTLFLEKRLEGTVAILGARNTWTLNGYQRDTRQLLAAVVQTQGASLSFPEVRERGVDLNWNHRLTGFTSLTARATWQRNTSMSGDEAQTILRRAELMAQTQFAPSTTGSAGIRHVRSDGRGAIDADYRENAVLVAVTHRF